MRLALRGWLPESLRPSGRGRGACAAVTCPLVRVGQAEVGAQLDIWTIGCMPARTDSQMLPAIKSLHTAPCATPRTRGMTHGASGGARGGARWLAVAARWAQGRPCAWCRRGCAAARGGLPRDRDVRVRPQARAQSNTSWYLIESCLPFAATNLPLTEKPLCAFSRFVELREKQGV